MSIDKISGRLVKHKHKGADILDITNYIGQPLGVFTTAYPTTPSVGRYDFAGTDGATVSGTVYNNGDSAFWDGSAWTRIPAQVMYDELNKLVSKTGDQTIAGVKTFSSSPVIPSATNNTEAQNKAGVESQLVGRVIYDVTKNNPTAGSNNNGKFESLSALLLDADLSTIIPSVVRCGGMSIRFIQSSDNKYVQYRLIADEWSTTVGDWQGVDDEPTANSNNLVKSGGVAKVLGIKQAIVCSIEGSFVDNTGAFVFHYAGARTDYLSLDGFGSIDVETSIGNGYYAIAFYDENKNIISAISEEPVDRTPVHYTIDLTDSAYANAKYVIISQFVYTASGYLLPEDGTIFKEIYELQVRTDELQGEIGALGVSKLIGKKLSIIGDSISTFEGYLPTDYATYYPNGNVSEVGKTWWGKLIQETGMILETNNSYSGSCVSTTIIPSRPAFASIERLSNIGNPDIIIIFGSHNDWYWEAVLGELWEGELPNLEHPLWTQSTQYNADDYVLWRGELYKCKTAHTSVASFNEEYWDVQYDTGIVAQAYQFIFHYLQVHYPSAKIYCCTSLQNRAHNDKGGQLCLKHDFSTPNYIPYSWVELDAVIRKACSQFGVEFVDLDKCGITVYNCPTYTVDGKLHPNELGMELIEKFILSNLIK